MSSIVKVVEIIAQSEESFDDAVRNAVIEAARSIKHIKGLWVDNMQCVVNDNRITEYRVNAKISFLVEGHTDLVEHA